MEPTPPVNAAACDVTTIFAPSERSSRLILSPMSSMTPSMAVATAEPMAIAAMMSALRRGARRNRFLDKAQNHEVASFAKFRSAGFERRRIDHQRRAIHMRLQRNRVATALRADRRNHDLRTAIPANHFRALLIIALRAADRAGIESRRQRVIRLLDHDEPHASRRHRRTSKRCRMPSLTEATGIRTAPFSQRHRLGRRKRRGLRAHK